MTTFNFWQYAFLLCVICFSTDAMAGGTCSGDCGNDQIESSQFLFEDGGLREIIEGNELFVSPADLGKDERDFQPKHYGLPDHFGEIELGMNGLIDGEIIHSRDTNDKYRVRASVISTDEGPKRRIAELEQNRDAG